MKLNIQESLRRKKSKDRFCKFLTVESSLKCDFCDVLCKSNECYIKHRAKVCSKIPKCEYCGSFKVKIHVCKGKWCFYCYIVTCLITSVLFLLNLRILNAI